MQFNRRNINKRLRNGDIISSSLYSSNSSGGGSSSGGILSGNYLPATKDEDGYIVPHYVKFQETTFTTDSDGNETETIKNLLEITKDGLIVNGHIIASGEISAYGSGSTSGNTSVGTIDIEDHLNSTRTDAALSANQGRLLKELIDNVEVDFSDYYNKSQIDYKLSNLNVDLSNYYNKIQIDEKLENLDDYYKKQEVDSKLNEKLDKSTWNDVFSIDSNGNLKIKVDVIGEGEISAYGSGTTASTEINLGNYYTKDEVDNLLDNIDVGDIDLSNYYTKTETTSNFAPKSHTHSQYADSGHSHALSELTSTAHTHNYTNVVKLGDKEYNVSNNVISLPSYPTYTLSGLGGVDTTTFNTHTGNSTAHITSKERENWSAAYNNNHSHSNKTVLDGITSAKVNNWNDVYSDWNEVFSINSDGSLKVKVNLYGEGEISAFGSGTTENEINLENYYTKNEVDDLLDNIDIGDIDLSNYYTKTETTSNFAPKSHTHSQYASSSHTHSISNITNLQSTLDGKSGTGHSHSNYSTTDHTHSNYSLTSHTHSYAASTHTHPISAITSLQTTLDGKSGTGHSHSNYSLTSHTHSAYAASSHTHSISNITNLQSTLDGKSGTGHTHSAYAASSHTHSISNITNLQSTLDGKSGTGHSHSNYSVTSHTHNYAGSSSAGGAATSANKVNSTLTFTGGTFAAKTFNGSAATTVNIPTHTSHITNNSGFITTAATVNAANKLATARTLWGQSFSGTANVSGNMTGVGSISASGTITSSSEITAYSDARLKSNVQPLKNRGYITPYTYTKDGKQQIGFLAQEMQQLYPELVLVDEDSEEKYLSVNYMQYTAVLQKQILDLKDEINELKKIIKDKDIN